MICTEVLGNLHEGGDALVQGRPLDHVVLSGGQLVKRLQRLRTEGGREIGVRLPSGSPDLRDGDLLALDPDGERVVIAVSAAPTDVVVIRPRSVLQMGFVAHSLGNRHLPAQFGPGPDGAAEMVVGHDHTVVSFLEHNDVPWIREERVLQEPLRHAEHTH